MKAVIFDMDGTMVDNMMVHHWAWQQSLRKLGLDLSLEEVRQQIHGVNYEILVRLFGDRFSHEERIAIADEKEANYRAIYRDEFTPIAGLMDWFETLHGANIPMAVATADPPENAHFLLDQLQIRDYFQAVFHAGDVQRGKPDPEIFLKAAAALDMPPEACLVFEDSPTGAAASYAAGCRSCIVTTTHAEDEFASYPNIIRFIADFTSLDLGFLKGM